MGRPSLANKKYFEDTGTTKPNRVCANCRNVIEPERRQHSKYCKRCAKKLKIPIQEKGITYEKRG